MISGSLRTGARAAQEGEPATARASSFSPVFVGLLVAGLVIRVLAMRSTWGQPDGDDAMAMLMARRASQGHFSLLFWGANYGGAIVTWIEGPLVAVFGMKIWLFRAIDTLQVLIAVLLLRAIGQRFLSRTAADVAAGTFWFFPAIWLFWSSREYVFWLPAIVFALATCLLILRWFETGSQHFVWASGLCAGLSIWSYPLVFSLIGPALIVLVWALRRDRKALVWVGAAALAGVVPWVAYFAVHGRTAFHLQSVTGSPITNLRLTVTRVLPTAFVGGQRRDDVLWALTNASPNYLTLLGVAIFAATAIVTVFAVLRRQVALATCGASVLIWPFVLVAGHVPLGADTYRYGLILIPPLLLIAAHLLSKVRLTALLAVVALASVIYTTSANTSSFAATPTCVPSLTDTGRLLVSHHRTAVWAAYWLSSPLELCSAGVTAGSVAPIRDHFAEESAKSAPRSTYVVFPGNTLDQQLLAWTRTHGIHATRTTATGYAIWEFNTKVTPTQIGLDSAF